SEQCSVIELLKQHPCGALMESPGLRAVLSDEKARAKFSRFCEQIHHAGDSGTPPGRRRPTLSLHARNSEPENDAREALRKCVLANTQIMAQSRARELEAALTRGRPMAQLNSDILKIERDALEELNADAFPRYVRQVISVAELDSALEGAILEALPA